LNDHTVDVWAFTRAAIWAEWNALSAEDRNPVAAIAAALSLNPALVAAVVYPAELFGVVTGDTGVDWFRDDKPAPPTIQVGQTVWRALLAAGLAIVPTNGGGYLLVTSEYARRYYGEQEHFGPFDTTDDDDEPTP
jgi:hypothetical protein